MAVSLALKSDLVQPPAGAVDLTLLLLLSLAVLFVLLEPVVLLAASRRGNLGS